MTFLHLYRYITIVTDPRKKHWGGTLRVPRNSKPPDFRDWQEPREAWCASKHWSGCRNGPSPNYFLLKSDLAQKAYGYLTDKEQSQFKDFSHWERGSGTSLPTSSALSVSHRAPHLPSRGLSEQLTHCTTLFMVNTQLFTPPATSQTCMKVKSIKCMKTFKN